MAPYENRFWSSQDGVRLHARDHAGGPGRPPLLCLPGLTRNARDFEELADRLAGDWRVIAVDWRGRGDSAPAKDPMSYVPATYVRDVELLLAELAVDRVVTVGTSLGGIVAMLLAMAAPGRIAAALLNDVGPEIEGPGLSRIRGYVGKASSFPTWMHAARALADSNGEVYPDWRIEDWLAMAKRCYRVNGAGRIVLDYDLKIAEPFRTPGNEAPPDLWQALSALRDVPTLIVRGERSDILAERTAERMVASLGRAELVTVPRVGHAPTLSEPAAQAAIDRLLAQVRKEPAVA